MVKFNGYTNRSTEMAILNLVNDKEVADLFAEKVNSLSEYEFSVWFAEYLSDNNPLNYIKITNHAGLFHDVLTHALADINIIEIYNAFKND